MHVHLMHTYGQISEMVGWLTDLIQQYHLGYTVPLWL